MPSLGPFLHSVRFWVVLWEADAKGISDSSIQVVKGIFVDDRYPFNLSLYKLVLKSSDLLLCSFFPLSISIWLLEYIAF